MNYDALVQSIVTLHREALGRAALAVNRSLVLRNWMIGACLVEFEQEGADRAAYGTGLLSRLSDDLRQHDVKGVSPDVLERMRLLYLHYLQLRTHISATTMRKLADLSGRTRWTRSSRRPSAAAKRRSPGSRASPPTVIRPAPKIGRNDPCPCGSGKNCKKCCLLNEEGKTG